MILAGDIGGTNTRLAWFDGEGKQMESIEVYKSQKYGSLSDIVREFITAKPHDVERACFGVAGPVRKGRSKISNLTWEVEASTLAAVLELDQVILANDLEVKAYGIASLTPDDFVVLNPGEPVPEGNEALIGAGTGLGEAGLHWEGDCHRPFPSEGGHVDFAPRNETEMDLLSYLMKEYDHVSYERVVSGPGLHNIYRFLRDTGRADEPRWLAEELAQADPPRVVSRHGLSGRSELCSLALDLFVSVYGAEAGNLTLKLMATAGLYVGGGIAPKILPKLEDGAFYRSFVAKGRMKPLLERVPVKVIQNDAVALLGAARLARLGKGGD